MDRRSFFSVVPAAILGLASEAMTGQKEVKDASHWVEMECRYAFYDYKAEAMLPPCGFKFKYLRGTMPICPKCGMCNEVKDKENVVGIPV